MARKRGNRKESAGTLLYRQTGAGIEVLLVHPSGWYNRKAPWGIPKGEVDSGDGLEPTARRETLEETEVTCGPLFPLGHIDYTKSRKRVHCFGGRAPDSAAPRVASWEVDIVEFLPMDRARELMHPEQRPFLDRLLAMISGTGWDDSHDEPEA